jgi:hypothetical protein
VVYFLGFQASTFFCIFDGQGTTKLPPSLPALAVIATDAKQMSVPPYNARKSLMHVFYSVTADNGNCPHSFWPRWYEQCL